MTYQYKLQIPISRELNKKLKEKTSELGFSSVSEITRFLLTNLVNGNLSIGFIGNQMNNNYKEDWGDIEETLRKALLEEQEGRILELDFSKPIHEQIVEGL